MTSLKEIILFLRFGHLLRAVVLKNKKKYKRNFFKNIYNYFLYYTRKKYYNPPLTCLLPKINNKDTLIQIADFSGFQLKITPKEVIDNYVNRLKVEIWRPPPENNPLKPPTHAVFR